MKNRTALKYALYILSLWLLFVSLFIMSYDKNIFTIISTYNNKDFAIFISKITPKNIVFLFSFIMMVAGFFYIFIFVFII